jgi:phosphoribosyl 1,2-cyclic phosphate phosphodiesterase
MRVQLLGTGGAEGVPAGFRRSRVGDSALEHGGKDLRTRSAAVVDIDLKIDFGPETFIQAARCGVDPRDWTGIVFTHSHDDHLARNELQYALFPFTDHEFAPFTVYGNETIAEKIWDRYPDWPFEVVITRSFERFSHGGYQITPIKANHKLDEDSQNLIIQHEGKTFLYGTDTGIWLDETWEFLRGFCLDGLVIECTDGFDRTTYYGHMDIAEMIGVVTRLREDLILKDGATVVTTHHGHLGNALHSELEAALRPHGIEPGFDGIVLEI